MSIVIGFLTVILVLDCLFLILLVLIQLPKKEAGAGVAFGGGATDALFGAGSGSALTKITKYAAAIFLGLSLLLAYLNTHRVGQSSRSLEEELGKKAAAPPMGVAAPAPGSIGTGAVSIPTLATSPSNAVPIQLLAPTNSPVSTNASPPNP